MADFIQSSQKLKQSKALAVVMFIIMLVIGGAGTGAVYYLETQKITLLEDETKALNNKIDNDKVQSGLEKDELELRLEAIQNELKVQEATGGDLKTFGDQIAITGEVPSSWSTFINPENVAQNSLPETPTAAISNNSIAFGDNNAGQVDFYYAEEDIVDELVNEEKDFENTELSEETVGGEKVQVLTYSLDEEGLASKAGTGGKKYFVKLNGRVKTLVIVKQTLGDDEYEKAFNLFLSKVQVRFGE